MELTKKEARWYGLTFLIIFVVMVLFALSGCSSTEKPIDTFKELICPPTYVDELKACEDSADRLESEVSRARADSNAYMVAHRRCMAKFDIELSKSR